MIDMSGQTVGHLFVIERTASTEDQRQKWHGSAMWRCRCECGEICVKSREELKQPHPSCGCMAAYYKQQSRSHRDATVRKTRQKRDETFPQEAALYLATFGTRRICPRCGKPFEQRTDDWGYVYRNQKYCRWRCLRAQQREDAEKKRGGSKCRRL